MNRFHMQRMIASMFLVGAIMSLYPWTGGLDGFTSPHQVDYVFPTLTAEQAVAMITKAITNTGSAKELTSAQVYENFKLVRSFSKTGPTPYEDLVKDNSVYSMSTALGQMNMNSINALDGVKKSMVLNGAEELCDKDPDCRQLDEYRKIDYNMAVLGGYLKVRYPLAMLIALPFFLIMMPVRRVRLIAELMQPLRPALALVAFPVSWKFYPHRDPRAEMTRALHFAGLALSFLLSTAGGAMAQTVKKGNGEDKKKRDEHTFYVDARASLYEQGGPPTPGLQVRGTLYRSRWLYEGVHIVNPRQGTAYSENGFGIRLRTDKRTKVNFVGIVSKGNNQAAKFIAGTQVFSRIGPVALPIAVARYERQITGPPNHTFAFNINPSIPVRGRWAIAPDVTVRKTLGQKLKWTVGAALRFNFGSKRGFAESGPFTGQDRVEFIRNRWNYSWAF